MNKEVDLQIFKHSKFRMKFKLSEDDIAYISVNGMNKVARHAENFIRNRLTSIYPDRDGKQTPFKGHPVFKAQHATATCCRGCLEKWHKISKDKHLSNEEIEYIVSFIMAWIENKCKSLPISTNVPKLEQLSLFKDMT